MSFFEAVTGLLAHLRLHRYAPATIDNYADQLQRFGEWLSQALADDLRRVTRADIDLYQAYVRGEPIGAECRALRMRAVKRLFDHLVHEGRLLLHPADHVVEIRRKPPALALFRGFGLYRSPLRWRLAGALPALLAHRGAHAFALRGIGGGLCGGVGRCLGRRALRRCAPRRLRLAGLARGRRRCFLRCGVILLTIRVLSVGWVGLRTR